MQLNFRIIFFLLFIHLTYHGSTQDLKVFRTDKYKYGYINSKGDTVIKPIYEFGTEFEDGFATVVLARKYGTININGKVLVPIKYDVFYNYTDGMAMVKLDYKYGFVNRAGKEVVPLKYDEALPFNDGLAIVKLNNREGYIDTTGKIIIPLQYQNVGYFYEGLAGVKKWGKWGFIDKQGNTIIPFNYDVAGQFINGFANVELNGKKFKINYAGEYNGSLVKKVSTPLMQEPLKKTVEQAVPVQDIFAFKNTDGKYGYRNNAGKIIIEPIYENAWPFGEGLAAVRLNDKVGIIDSSGNTILPFVYKQLADKGPKAFEHGLLLITKTGPLKYIDKSGNIAFPEYEYEYPFSEGLARVVLKARQGFIDRSGNVVIPVKFEYLSDFSEGYAAFLEGSYPTFENGRWGFLDIHGTTIPASFSDFFDFSEGLAAVKRDDSWGYIDKNGWYMIELKYKEAHPFINGLARVKITDKWMFINKTNKIVIPAKFDEAKDFSEGLACVKLGRLYGFIDKTGKEIIGIKYKTAGSFLNGVAFVQAPDNSTFFINKKGIEVKR